MEVEVPQLVKDDPYLGPHTGQVLQRIQHTKDIEASLLGDCHNLSDFANGHLYYGLFHINNQWIIREWAPNATLIYLIGPFSDWKEQEAFRLKTVDNNGTWELVINGDVLKHLDYFKLSIHWNGGKGERIPSYANYVVQDEQTKLFCARIWAPEHPHHFSNQKPKWDDSLLIYEAHIGMAHYEERVGSYNEFRMNVLPRIARGGYNAIQLMAIQEHPYYGSFGYQVSNFFAPSSRFGTPDELKHLIDDAHGYGLKVIMDIVHSHAVKNELEGLANFDGSSFQYFHEGPKGNHPAWDTKCFNYARPQVIHFLLSNCKYWLEEFKFDGFRFDGVTSMIYWNHGLGKSFSSYNDYYDDNVDLAAVTYLTLANKLIHQINSHAVTISEDMSGMPGMSFPIEEGGLGFDFRLAMGIPDFWIKMLKDSSDEFWNMDQLWYEMTNRRWNEPTISYCESHDQALVGDKTLIFWLVDKDMYTNFSIFNRNHIVDRGISLHKMIRLLTLVTAGGGYLNFMGNEWGHPEWIDFPRVGNNWSYHYARRQWPLVDDQNLCYKFLNQFDIKMLEVVQEHRIFDQEFANKVYSHCDDHVLAIERGGLIFIFNFHPQKSYSDYGLYLSPGTYVEIFHSDQDEFGGFERLHLGQEHKVVDHQVRLYLPSRTVLVLKLK